ncbi:hypothetical protein [Pseudomonas sp.]|jgi:hypothetical protein|uniref:hypothetical protein n=1 Tax=Pseudomonas sp. TaxID=306 RepID=UPI0037C5D84A
MSNMSVRVEWSRFDKVTIKFTTKLILGETEQVSHELVDRRLLKRMKALSGPVESRCKQLADQKANAVHEALRLRLAALTQARHVTAQETN